MGSVMPPRQEEEFELVLGNKQLLSLFFVIVALFAVFFTFGYSVGFTQGQQERVAVIANDEPPDPPPADVRLPAWPWYASGRCWRRRPVSSVHQWWPWV